MIPSPKLEEYFLYVKKARIKNLIYIYFLRKGFLAKKLEVNFLCKRGQKKDFNLYIIKIMLKLICLMYLTDSLLELRKFFIYNSFI